MRVTEGEREGTWGYGIATNVGWSQPGGGHGLPSRIVAPFGTLRQGHGVCQLCSDLLQWCDPEQPGLSANLLSAELSSDRWHLHPSGSETAGTYESP